MVTMGAAAVALGVFFLVGGGVFWALRLHSRIRLRRLRTAVRLSCGELRTGHLPRRALVVGTTEPGPEGMLRSPAFDRECIWFSMEVTDSTGDSVQVAHHTATGHLGVRDRTGSVLVDPRLVLQEIPSVLVRTSTGDGPLSPMSRGSSGSLPDRLEQSGHIPRRARRALFRRHLTVEERVIEPGCPVTVLATPHRLRDNVVLLGAWGATSVKEPDDWITELEDDIAAVAAVIRWFPIVGLVACATGALLIAVSLGPG